MRGTLIKLKTLKPFEPRLECASQLALVATLCVAVAKHTGHTSEMTCLVVLPEDTLASGSMDNTLCASGGGVPALPH